MSGSSCSTYSHRQIPIPNEALLPPEMLMDTWRAAEVVVASTGRRSGRRLLAIAADGMQAPGYPGQ